MPPPARSRNAQALIDTGRVAVYVAVACVALTLIEPLWGPVADQFLSWQETPRGQQIGRSIPQLVLGFLLLGALFAYLWPTKPRP